MNLRERYSPREIHIWMSAINEIYDDVVFNRTTALVIPYNNEKDFKKYIDWSKNDNLYYFLFISESRYRVFTDTVIYAIHKGKPFSTLHEDIRIRLRHASAANWVVVEGEKSDLKKQRFENRRDNFNLDKELFNRKIKEIIEEHSKQIRQVAKGTIYELDDFKNILYTITDTLRLQHFKDDQVVFPRSTAEIYTEIKKFVPDEAVIQSALFNALRRIDRVIVDSRDSSYSKRDKSGYTYDPIVSRRKK